MNMDNTLCQSRNYAGLGEEPNGGVGIVQQADGEHHWHDLGNV